MRLLLLLALLIPASALAESQSDIVWPTYAQAEQAGDTALDCAQLAREAAHVTADVSLLRHAQTRTEDVLHSLFDMERYGASNGPGGRRVNAGIVEGKERYAAARVQIVASLRVALARQDHLKSLEPACHPAPQQASVP